MACSVISNQNSFGFGLSRGGGFDLRGKASWKILTPQAGMVETAIGAISVKRSAIGLG